MEGSPFAGNTFFASVLTAFHHFPYLSSPQAKLFRHLPESLRTNRNFYQLLTSKTSFASRESWFVIGLEKWPSLTP